MENSLINDIANGWNSIKSSPRSSLQANNMKQQALHTKVSLQNTFHPRWESRVPESPKTTFWVSLKESDKKREIRELDGSPICSSILWPASSPAKSGPGGGTTASSGSSRVQESHQRVDLGNIGKSTCQSVIFTLFTIVPIPPFSTLFLQRLSVVRSGSAIESSTAQCRRSNFRSASGTGPCPPAFFSPCFTVRLALLSQFPTLMSLLAWGYVGNQECARRDLDGRSPKWHPPDRSWHRTGLSSIQLSCSWASRHCTWKGYSPI